MVRSMTGFGRGTASDTRFDMVVEIHSVNNRFLDIVIRGGREVMQQERRIKEYLRQHLERGRIVVSLDVEGTREGEPVVDIEKANAYLDILKALKERFNLSGEPDLALLSGFRDVISSNTAEEVGEELWDTIQPALEDAVQALMVMRQMEGAALEEDMVARLEAIENELSEIEELAPERSKVYARRLRDRVEEVLEGTEIDENRLYNEIALYTDRIDLSEECTRLRSHLNQARQIMSGEDPAGRQLNFLLQEMHREVNTLGSKSNEHEISHIVVCMKEELEKIREQVQNIE